MPDNFFLPVATAVLLPMIPAYILFKFLPTDAGVDGPFNGLKLKLTGAFGGYFIVMLAVMAFIRPLLPDKVEIWTVKGRIIAPEVTNMANLKISAVPDHSHKTSDKAFAMRILVFPDETGNPDFPDLMIEHDGYRPQTIGIAKVQQGCSITREKKEVTITGDCLKLTKMSDPPAYETSLVPVTEQ